MKDNKYFKLLTEMAVLVFACFMAAIGIYNFADTYNFPLTGFSGIALIINYLFKVPLGVTTILLNIPVALICYRKLGKRFFWRSIFCTVLYSVMVDYLCPLLPVYKGEKILAALCSGVFGGIGYALIYMRNASTGGTDFISVYVKSILPHISLGKIIFIVDAVIVVAGGVLMGDIDGIVYGLVISFVTNLVIDKMMYGSNAGKLTLIITTKADDITKVIDKVTERGTTVIDVKGGYRNEDKQMVICACNDKEMYLLEQAVKHVDPESFSVVLESSEVHGEGFKLTRVANGD
ncbi:MAG: YitT family protein [Clostridia bacterium]|nr:YitT family protein [Clostridia bacterium]